MTQQGPDSGGSVNAMSIPLTAEDRCDRCHAQAYLRVTLEQGGELLFCIHHGRDHLPSLHARYPGADFHDESAKLAAPLGAV